MTSDNIFDCDGALPTPLTSTEDRLRWYLYRAINWATESADPLPPWALEADTYLTQLEKKDRS